MIHLHLIILFSLSKPGAACAGACPTILGMAVEIREPTTAREFSEYYDLRWRVLRQPWNGDKPDGNDEAERTAIHLAAWDDERLVGAGRLHFLSPDEAQVRGMAVERGYAGKGIGSILLRSLERRAAQAGVTRIVLHARENAVEFYRKNQYEVVERSYTLFGSIEHWRMCKSIRLSD
jgi:ribosomal protein S18 acetylase RimI-like enzyme